MKLPIVFFGSSAYVLPIIETLNAHFDLKLVVTTEQKPTDAVLAYCLKHEIAVLSTNTLKTDEIEIQLRDIDAPIAVVASFGLLIPEEIIEIFPKGIVNIHPSYLPYYRGATPIQSAIANGDTETAISIMVIDTELDHGPLLSQLPLEISAEDTAESLYIKAFKLGAEKLVDILPAYVAGTIESREQDHAKATYTPRHLTRESGFIDIQNPPANTANLVRAYSPWPGVWTKITINGQEKILKLLPNTNRHPELDSGSQINTILFQVEGKKPVSKKDLLNGYPELKEVIEQLS